MGIRDAWEQSLQREGHVRDPAQEQVVAELETLQQALEAAATQRRGWLRRWRKQSGEPVRGLYIWGGVGRGKTFLMDLFYETLSVDSKKRVHFHRMMRDVHCRLQALGNIEDPLDRVAEQIAAESSNPVFRRVLRQRHWRRNDSRSAAGRSVSPRRHAGHDVELTTVRTLP